MAEFLTTFDVIEIHAVAIEEFGGPAGIRDEFSLESAVFAPVSVYDYELDGKPSWALTTSEWASLGAAYWFHISGNHPFVDGNKRTAVATCETFLLINGLGFQMPDSEMIRLGLAVAEGEIATRQELAVAIRGYVDL